MRLVLHHLRKDLFAMWPLVAMWILVLSIYLLLPQEGSVRDLQLARRLQTLLVAVHWALAAVLPAMLILQDPAAGTRAFWMTRPISRLRMLASKLLGLTILFVLLPLAFQLPGLLRAGLSGWHLATGVAESTLQVASVSLASAALASTTTSLGRYLLLLAICVLGATYFGPLLLSSTALAAAFGAWPSLSSSREIARLALLLPLATVMLLLQWRTRKTYRSLAFAAIAVVAVSWTTIWPWDFLGQPARPLEDSSVSLEPAEARRCVATGADPSRIILCGRVLVADPAVGSDLEVRRIDSRLVFPDGRTIVHRAFGRALWVYPRTTINEDPTTQPTGAATAPHAFQALLRPSRKIYRKYATIPGRLEVDLVLASLATNRLGAMPVENGARLRAGTTSVTVERVNVLEGPSMEIELELRVRRLELLFAPSTWSRSLDIDVEHRASDRPFQATSSDTSHSGDLLVLPRPRLRSYREHKILLLRDGKRTPGAGLPTTADETRNWLGDAEIVLRQEIHTDTHRVALRLEEFRMADYALGQSPLVLGSSPYPAGAPSSE